MPSLVIRDTKESDLEGIVKIENESFGDYGHPLSLRIFKQFLLKYPYGFRVLELEGNLAGYSFTTRPKKKIFSDSYSSTIYSLAVDPKFRRLGVGTNLVLDAISRTRSLGLRPIKLKLQVSVDNAGARKLYSKLGFEKTRILRSYYGLDANAIEMEMVVAN